MNSRSHQYGGIESMLLKVNPKTTIMLTRRRRLTEGDTAYVLMLRRIASMFRKLTKRIGAKSRRRHRLSRWQTWLNAPVIQAHST